MEKPRVIELDTRGACVVAIVSHLVKTIVYAIMFLMAFFGLKILSISLTPTTVAWVSVLMVILTAAKPKNATLVQRGFLWFELPVTMIFLVVVPSYGLTVGKQMGLFFLVMFIFNLVAGVVAYAESEQY
jgi:hypothetical protein